MLPEASLLSYFTEHDFRVIGLKSWMKEDVALFFLVNFSYLYMK